MPGRVISAVLQCSLSWCFWLRTENGDQRRTMGLRLHHVARNDYFVYLSLLYNVIHLADEKVQMSNDSMKT